MQNTKVKDIMTKNPTIINKNVTLKNAAEKMRELDCGVLPVGEKDNVYGIITDRDIVIRAIAKGKPPESEQVESCMTSEVFFCNESDTLQQAADTMHKNQVSRLVVKDDNGKVCGILSFGCILRKKASTAEIADVVAHALGKRVA